MSDFPMLKYVEAVDYALRVFSQSKEAQKKTFGVDLNKAGLDDDGGREILQVFLKRAYRGYVNVSNEVAIIKAYNSYRQKHKVKDSLYYAMKIALLSPAFTYRIEAIKKSKLQYRVSSHELANRLSYFLWSSMPDKELLAAANSGVLGNERELLAQVERMLNSPKRLALSENFAGQWLGFEALKKKKVFYKSERWNRGIYDELLFFFDELIKSDRSILELVRSDWIYKSDFSHIRVSGKKLEHKEKYTNIFQQYYQRPKGRLEKFYKPPRLISLKEGEKLGGIITSGGIMRLTSAPERTSPIRRGVGLAGSGFLD